MFKELYNKYILRYQKYLIIMAICAITLGVITIILKYGEDNKKLEPVLDPNIALLDEVKEQSIPEEVEQYYMVDIKGAVTNPNVYRVVEGSRIADVIKIAGGLTKEADTSVLNLSKIIHDEMVIIIYTKNQIAQFKKDNITIKEVIKYIEKDCQCPDPDINDACFDNDSEENDTSGLISINNATKDELMTLSGIGESKALDIIEYRHNNGPFKSIEDIKKVPGIGDSIFAKIKDYLTL